MVGDHIVLAAHSAGLLDVLILGEKKLGIGDPAVALPACYQPAAVCLLRIFGVVDDSADGLSHRATFAGVERHQACGCHVGHLLKKQNGLPKQTSFALFYFFCIIQHITSVRVPKTHFILLLGKCFDLGAAIMRPAL